MNGSISRRLLVASGLLVFAFLGLAGLSLDTAYRESSRDALHERLQAHIYTLLATATEDAQGRMRLPEALSAPAFNRPDSGLYAQVLGEQDRYHWRSGSMLGRHYEVDGRLAVGGLQVRQSGGLTLLEQAVSWEDYSGTPIRYVLSVAADSTPLLSQQAAFRRTLWGWLGGIGVLLLLTQLWLVRWGLRPLHHIAERVQQVEDGQRERIDGPVPRELLPLTENLNSLIQQGQARQQRIRNSLADLSHSLKTPLAVLRGAAAQPHTDMHQLIAEQTERIDQIVSYHRQRAAVAGGGSLLAPLALRPIVQRIADSLLKVYRDKGLVCRVELPDSLRLRADEGDLFELFGNLLENACKHARQQVAVTAQGQRIRVDDDGEGIAADQVERVLQRGERADQRNPGEGIGLAVVREIVHQYQGKLHIGRSPSLGGARIEVQLQVAAGPPVERG